MEKKTYSKPLMAAQRFEPQEYCHSCWLVMCNYRGYAFQDKDGSGTFNQRSERVHNNADHTPAELVILKDGESPAANCYASKSDHWEYGDWDWSGHPDGASYTSTSFIPAFWFKATRNGVEESTANHICDLAPGSYKPYEERGVARPNHS